VGLDNSWLR